jgi:hypothetical protein
MTFIIYNFLFLANFFVAYCKHIEIIIILIKFVCFVINIVSVFINVCLLL